MVTSFLHSPPQPRIPGAVNWLGLWTLIMKEIRRFTKIFIQTLIAPLVSTLLFYFVFDIAMGGSARSVDGVPYMNFLAPGLIVMSMAQGGFSGTSGTLVVSKIQGSIVDVLMPPLSSVEFVLGYTLGGITRALAVAVVSVVVVVIIGVPLLHPLHVIYFAVMGSMMMVLLGFMSGIWAEKFDHLAVVQNFIIGPATFLSGTFYSASRLPEGWQVICHANPFFYMIDGFRYGFTGVADGNLAAGFVVMAVSNLILFLLAWRMIASGYKLKS